MGPTLILLGAVSPGYWGLPRMYKTLTRLGCFTYAKKHVPQPYYISQHDVNQHLLQGDVGERKVQQRNCMLGRGMRGALTVGAPFLTRFASLASFADNTSHPPCHIMQSWQKTTFCERSYPTKCCNMLWTIRQCVMISTTLKMGLVLPQRRITGR